MPSKQNVLNTAKTHRGPQRTAALALGAEQYKEGVKPATVATEKIKRTLEEHSA